jgi:hypothetical protein
VRIEDHFDGRFADMKSFTTPLRAGGISPAVSIRPNDERHVDHDHTAHNDEQCRGVGLAMCGKKDGPDPEQ